MQKIISLIICSIVFLACAVSKFEVNEASLPVMQQKVPGITLERARQGYRLYASHCAACHHLFNPGKYSIGEWNKILINMFPKAKLTDDQQQKLIIDYLHALSK